MGMSTDDILSTEDLITPERRAKGDLQVAYNRRGKVSQAIPVNLTIVKELIRCKRFPHYYEIYGIGLLELRAAFLAPWRARNSVALLESDALEQLGIRVGDSGATEMYHFLCKNFGMKNINIIQWVVESPERRSARLRVGVLKERRHDRLDLFCNCFDLLVQLMDDERDRISKGM